MYDTNEENCTFCRMREHKLSHVALLEDEEVLAVMDLYPAAPGHVLVLPKRHIETIYEMPEDLGAQIMRVAILVAKALKEKLSPNGINLIQSNEAAAGQTVQHFHLHIVPRYKDDRTHLEFGHGNRPENILELERIASILKTGLGEKDRL